MSEEEYIYTYEELQDLVLKYQKENKELKCKIRKAIEIIDLVKPELWNIDNKMTYRLIDIKNVLIGDKENE